MRGSLMTGFAAACGLAMTVLACGPGSVAPPDNDDAQTDDDVITDDDAGDDDAATGGTGTISVTVEMLAVLADGQTVEAEIVVDGGATGVFAPAELETDTGSHTVTLKANEPDAPVAQRFVAAPHDVSVIRDGTVACPMFLGRDLGGMWRLVEKNGEASPNDEHFSIVMEFAATPQGLGIEFLPCHTSLWAVGINVSPSVVCLIADNEVWTEYDDPNYPILVEGEILDNGYRMRYTVTATERGWESGPWVFERQE